jgi:PEP-CTERM motif
MSVQNRKQSINRVLLVAAVILFAAVNASAGIVTFNGQDDGAGTGGPFPNSLAAQTAFQAAASLLSPISLIDFENQPLGYNANFTAAPGVTVALTGNDFGDGFSGISTTTFGNLFGFNTTPGGAKWLGFPGGTATFNFANPTDFFGFWTSGVQTIFTSSLTVAFNDGTSESLNLPINVNGGASFFGFTDAGASISSITISNISNDAWGIDDVQFDATPEPSSILLFGTGALCLAGMLRRKISRQ